MKQGLEPQFTKILKMSEQKNKEEVYVQAAAQEEVIIDTEITSEEISTEKSSVWNVAKKIFLGASIVFLLFAIISTSLLLANKPLRDSVSNMVWNGGEFNLPEIDVFGKKMTKTHVHRTHPVTSKTNDLKILRTVAESDTHRSKEAIAFTPDIQHIPIGKLRKQDAELLPERFKNDNPELALSEEYFDFVRLPDNVKCSTAKVAITVKSSVNHFEHRQAIRASWASLNSTEVSVVFLVGLPQNDSSLLAEVEAESDAHSDIVLGDYVDSYANLTIKALTGLAWREKYCPEPDFALSIDDDTYVDLNELLDHHLSRLPQSQDFVECSERTVVNGKVWREGRWAVDQETYDADKYPNYCNGPCYLMPKTTSRKLFEASRRTASDLQADDALITGVLRTKIQIPLIQYTRTKSPGWCSELSNRKPHLPKRMMKEFERRSSLASAKMAPVQVS